jgi:hypothetical protein
MQQTEKKEAIEFFFFNIHLRPHAYLFRKIRTYRLLFVTAQEVRIQHTHTHTILIRTSTRRRVAKIREWNNGERRAEGNDTESMKKGKWGEGKRE